MGAESTLHPPPRPRTPSRLSNCGEMVAESVLEQLEEELLLEDLAAQSRMQSPGGRKLLVGMKLNATCREMLAWTIADLARPGDHIVAFHVASFPLHSVTTSREYEEHFEQLANILRGFLAVYEGLCILKQIILEVEILPGLQVKKTLVDFAKSHTTCKLILGSDKHFTVRRSKSLGRYCLKRLPCTCTVVVLQHSEIILNEKGKLSRTDIARIGAGMIKTLRRGMKSFGRSKKVMNGESFDDGSETPPGPSDASTELTFPVELEKCYFSDSTLFDSSLIEEFDSALLKPPSPRLELHRSDMFLLEDLSNGCSDRSSRAKSLSVLSPSCYNTSTDDSRFSTSSEDIVPGWPLMRNTIGFDKVKPVFECFAADKNFLAPSLQHQKPAPSPMHRRSVDKEKPAARSPLHLLSIESLEKLAPSSLQRRFSEKVKGARSPIQRFFSEKEAPVPSRIDLSQITVPSRNMSVVDWALQLPHRSGDFSNSPEVVTAKADYARMLGEIARDAFRAASDGVPEGSQTQSPSSDDSCRANKKVKFSLEMPKSREWSQQLSLAQRLDSLCLNRKCKAFAYEELKTATSNFSSSNVVGRGGGSEVYKGMMADGKLVAVKRLNCGPQAVEELLNDVGINTSLSHPNIVTLLGYCVDSSHPILVFTYLPEGNLEDRLHATGTQSPVLPWRVRYKVAIGTAKALDYLHNGTSRPVIHRDVKASNILLTADFESQLSDFGLAKWAPKKASHILCDDILGTFGYLAPEYFMYGRVNNKTDVYAFGVVLLELITGRSPIDNTKPKGHENLVNWARPLLKDNNLNELVDSRLKGAYDVEQMKRLLLAASLCVRQSSQRRPHMSRVLQMLCSNHSRLQTLLPRSVTSREDNSSIDLEECDVNIAETHNTSGECATTDIKTHFPLAMVGVDDNVFTSQRNSLDHRGVDRLHSGCFILMTVRTLLVQDTCCGRTLPIQRILESEIILLKQNSTWLWTEEIGIPIAMCEPNCDVYLFTTLQKRHDQRHRYHGTNR